jgi:hypothetical protein
MTLHCPAAMLLSLPLQCADGCNYALNAQSCDEQGQCTKCDDNWARTANGTCVPCPDFCDECDVADDGAVVCLSCFHQYTLNKDGSECLSCEDPNCYECPEGPAVCANCTLFALPNGTCAADAGIDGCSNTDSTGKACTQVSVQRQLRPTLWAGRGQRMPWCLHVLQTRSAVRTHNPFHPCLCAAVLHGLCPGGRQVQGVQRR